MANSLGTKCLLHKIFILLVLLLMEATKWCACSSSNSSTFMLGCKVSEREALLKFKHSLSYFDPDVSSTWEGDDCCKWRRVGCDPTTGDVVKLQLHGQCPSGYDYYTPRVLFGTKNLELSLQHLKELKHMEHLDISCNYDFETSKMPKALGSMQQLRYLNLSYTSFKDDESSTDVFSNLTHLQVLDLNLVDSLKFSNLEWVSSLRELEYLDMGGSNLSLADDWAKSLIGPLPSLRELRLRGCNLPAFDKNHQNYSLIDAHIPIRYLELSGNDMGGDIPLWLGKLQSLVHLDLTSNGFTSIEGGNLWSLVHNLCNLRSLILSNNELQGNSLVPWENITSDCIRHNLVELDLSTSNIGLNHTILASLGVTFQSLKRLDLSNSQLSGQIPTTLSMLSSLEYLDLSENSLVGTIPTTLTMLSSLEYLDLSRNSLVGTIPTSLGNLSVLKELYLHDNKLSQISSFLNFPPSLEEINLSLNNLTGQIPKSLGNLTKLQSLLMFSNPFLEGTVMSETHFFNLSNLAILDLSDTFLTLKLPLDWMMPSSQIRQLSIGTCKINGPFPRWLQTQKSLGSLNLSNAHIYGEIPKWFHNKMQQLVDVDLSHNHINGSLIFPIQVDTIDFSNNSFSGPFVFSDIIQINITYPSATFVDLSSNLISGQFPEEITWRMPSLKVLDLSNNQIYGPIPKSFCNLSSDLSYVGLSSNKLSGNIPCFGPNVGYLHLSNNKLSGTLPPCLMNSTHLLVLDVGGNELSGNIPSWLNGENFPWLKILRLRGNLLSDSIPLNFCLISTLQILDFAQNRFSGTIPSCISNLIEMGDYARFEFSYYPNTNEKINEVIKGIERGYTSTLEYLVNIDLSCNELVGNIPDGITDLSELVGLNLSYNQLSGVIPQEIGAMKSLESLDLSNNRLWGTIPTSMADLNALSYLNLSYNNFSGQMPTGNQLQTLVDPSSYAGNPFLCGEFLPKKCKTVNSETNGSDKNKGGQEDEDGDNKHETLWFYLVVMSGFATGFWGVVGTLLLQRGWRHTLFRRVEDAYDWLNEAIADKMASLKKMWKGSSTQSTRSG